MRRCELKSRGKPSVRPWRRDLKKINSASCKNCYKCPSPNTSHLISMSSKTSLQGATLPFASLDFCPFLVLLQWMLLHTKTPAKHSLEETLQGVTETGPPPTTILQQEYHKIKINNYNKSMKFSRHACYYLKWPHPVRVKSTVVETNYTRLSAPL